MAINPLLLNVKPISEITTVNNPTEGHLLFYDGSDELKKVDIVEFQSLIGGIAKPLAISDASPTVSGWYKPTTVGTYANAGGLVAQVGYDTLFYFDGTTWSKVEVELNVPNGNVEEGNTQAVSGGEVFNKRGYAYVGEKANLNEAIVSVIPAQRKLGFELTFYNTTLSMMQTYKYVSSDMGGWGTLGKWKEVSRVGQIYNLQGSYTLTTAINAVPSTQRKIGLIITFQDLNNRNRTKAYLYQETSTNSWAILSSWQEIIQKNSLDTAILNYDKSTQLVSLKNNTTSFRIRYQDATAVDIDGDFSIMLDYEFNSFPANTQYLVSKGAHAYTHQGYSVTAIGDKLMFKIKDRVVKTDIELNVLHRYFFVKKGRDISIYVDGVLSNTTTSDIDLPTSNYYYLQLGQYSYNNIGEALNGNFKNFALIDSSTLDYAKYGNIKTVVDENTLSFKAFLKAYGIVTANADLKGLETEYVGVADYYYIKEVTPSKNSDKIYSNFRSMYKYFPEVAKIGKYTAFRNTDVKSGVITNDYDVNYGDELKTLQTLEKRTLTNLIYAVDKYGVCYGVRNNNIIVKSEDAGVTWTDLLTISTLNKISFIYCTNDNELLLLEDTYRDDANLSNDRIGGIWKTSTNKTTASKIHTLSNRYQTFQPSWSIEIVDDIIYFSEYGNSYNTGSYDPMWIKGTKGDAVRIWKSTNSGDSFTLFVNLNDLTALYPNNGNLHIHSIHWDKFWKRLWITTGDGGAAVKSNKKLIWTDDDGVSFNGIDLSNYFNGGFQGSSLSPYENLQGLSMFSTNDFLLIGSDNWHNAIFRVNKRKKDDISLDVAFETSPIVNDVVYFTGRMKKLDNLPILIQLGRGDAKTQEGQDNQQPRIIATYNGFDFKEVWSDISVLTASDFTFQFFKIQGSYYFTYEDFIVRFEY